MTANKHYSTYEISALQTRARGNPLCLNLVPGGPEERTKLGNHPIVRFGSTWVTFTCANVIAVQVKEDKLVAPACCFGVGLSGDGNKDWDTFTNSGAEVGLPKGKVPTVGVVPRAYFAKKPQGDPA